MLSWLSSLFRLTRDNHVQTNRHRANYDSWLITTPSPSSALASSTTSSWLLLESTLTLPLEWSLAYLPWWVLKVSRSWHDCSLGSCSPGQHPLRHDGDWERLVTKHIAHFYVNRKIWKIWPVCVFRYVESWAEKLGATPPNLSSEQLEMTR